MPMEENRETPWICLFAVTFDQNRKPMDAHLTRGFPVSAASDPAAFFAPEDYCPMASIAKFLAETPAWARHFVLVGTVTYAPLPGHKVQEKVQEILCVTGMSKSVLQENAAAELIKKGYGYVFKAIDARDAQDRVGRR